MVDLLDSNDDLKIDSRDVKPMRERLDTNNDKSISENELNNGTNQIVYDVIYEDALSNPAVW